MQGYKFMLW